MRGPLIILGVLWLLLAAVTIGSQLVQPPPITVEWRTESEVNTAGFNVYRATAAGGPYTKLNEGLIPGMGNATSGASYAFSDETVMPGETYYYRLEDVELDSSSAQHAPIEYTAPLFAWWLPIVAIGSVMIGVFLIATGLRANKPETARKP